MEFFNHINAEFVNSWLFENVKVVGSKNNTLRFLPFLTISKTNINLLIDILDNILKNLRIN